MKRFEDSYGFSYAPFSLGTPGSGNPCVVVDAEGNRVAVFEKGVDAVYTLHQIRMAREIADAFLEYRIRGYKNNTDALIGKLHEVYGGESYLLKDMSKKIKEKRKKEKEKESKKTDE